MLQNFDFHVGRLLDRLVPLKALGLDRHAEATQLRERRRLARAEVDATARNEIERRDHLGNFLDAARRETPPHCNVELGASTMVAIKMGVEAYRTGLQLTGEEPGEIELPTSPAALSYMVPYVLEMDVESKQELLESTSVRDRLEILIDYLKQANDRLRAQLEHRRVSEAVRGNGDLGHPGSSS